MPNCISGEVMHENMSRILAKWFGIPEAMPYLMHITK